MSDNASREAPAADSLTAVAYSALEELIVRLELAPGATVTEQQLCGLLGIGRTPIREALQRLVHQGLVKVLPRKGILISPIDPHAQLRLLAVRREVERLVVRSAATAATVEERHRFLALAGEFERSGLAGDDVTFLRTDREFNEQCLASARNEFASAAMETLQPLARRFWFHHYRQAADLPESARLHAAVARAIGEGRPDAAATALDALLDVIETFTRSAGTPPVA